MATHRDQVIRRHFEAMRDLTWARELEPKFRRHGVSAEVLEDYREAWNRHAERKDWPWWQAEAKRYSTDRLDDMLADCIDKLNAHGLLQRQRENKRARETDQEQGEIV